MLIALSYLSGQGIPSTQIWQKLESVSHDIPASDLKITPTIYGERHLPDQHASVSNITTQNISLGSVYRSLCKGIIANLHEMMSQQYIHNAGIDRIIASGTAISKNTVLREEIENHYKLPLHIGNGCDAAVGAALALID